MTLTVVDSFTLREGDRIPIDKTTEAARWDAVAFSNPAERLGRRMTAMLVAGETHSAQGDDASL